MAPTPSPKPGKEHATPSKTPHSKHRLHFPGGKTPSAAVPSPLTSLRENSVPTEHPVEVIGRIRDYPERKERPPSALEIAEDGRSVRVRTDIGYRDFTLDGVSVSADEDLEEFYSRFVETRVRGVRVGAKCTIMMHGPTGAGKSHTMFGCPKQPGIVYRALRNILGEGGEENSAGSDNGGFGVGLFVQVAVLEIYNEEIYDLLSGYTGGGANGGLPKGSTPKARLEIMGKKAKNATYISGNEPGKISKEVAKVEKRRIVKSTLCNERSSRSHCLIILDVPSVGGRLMLVDMAGSENIEQAGQNGFEAKMQTAKINQGNTALKRVVESIANGDSHVPFRDSKLTMLLQDSFEDDKSKILMILCASPDPAEMHRTLSTLEYGAKAKCIVRAAHILTPCKTNSEESSVVLSSRIVAMNQFIFKLQVENKLKEKERDEAQRELTRKEEEVSELRAKLIRLVEASAVKEEEIESKVDERTHLLRLELEKMARRMQQQQEELEILRQRLVEMEGGGKGRIVDNSEKLDEAALQDIGARFANRLSALCADRNAGMEESMEMDLGDSIVIHDVKEVRDDEDVAHRVLNLVNPSPCGGLVVKEEEEGDDALMSRFPEKVFLSTVFEGEEGEEEQEEEEEEVEKEVIEENNDRYSSTRDLNFDDDHARDMDGTADDAAAISSRRTRIQNIFRLCGNHRELAQQVRIPTPTKRKPCGEENPSLSPQSKSRDPEADLLITESFMTKSPVAGLHLADEQRSTETKSPKGHSLFSDKENNRPVNIDEKEEAERGLDDIYVKWEASKDVSSGNLKKLQVLKNSTLADLRKSIETHLTSEQKSKQDFTFLLLGDPTGAPVAKEKEVTTQVGRLPICNNQLGGHLACLRPRPCKTTNQQQQQSKQLLLLPFSPLENKLTVAAVNSPSKMPPRQVEGASPNMSENMGFLAGFRV